MKPTNEKGTSISNARPWGKSRRKGIILTLILVGGITCMILSLTGFEMLDINEFGLKQNVFTKEIVGEPVRGGGWQFVGLDYDYIRFPATWQPIDFTTSSDADASPINTQTRDGLAITFDASFQYKLNISALETLYSNFGLDYHQQIVEVARGSLRNIAAMYSATEFLQNRSDVANSMRVSIIADLTSMKLELDYFQLRAITLPFAFMDATEDVEVARLQQQIAAYEFAAAQIEAQQIILDAEVAANISLIAAYASANVSMIDATAQAFALNITRAMESATLADLMNATGMNATMVIAFLYVQALEHLPAGTTLVIGDFISLLLEPEGL